MNGKTYKKLKEQLSRDEEYAKLKKVAVENMSIFDFKEDLFNLVHSVKAGKKILELEDFPLTEYNKWLKKHEL